MSTDRWRWAEKAHRLRFEQLETARKQAESWRTGLAGLTTVLGATLIVKGRDSITTLDTWRQWVIVLLLWSALAALVTGTVLAIRAASGTPSDECLLTGEDLEAWTRHEALSMRRALRMAGRATIAGICVIAFAIGFAWLSPEAAPATARQQPARFIVKAGGTEICGTLVGADHGYLIVMIEASGTSKRTAPGNRVLPLSQITEIVPTKSCPS